MNSHVQKCHYWYKIVSLLITKSLLVVTSCNCWLNDVQRLSIPWIEEEIAKKQLIKCHLALYRDTDDIDHLHYVCLTQNLGTNDLTSLFIVVYDHSHLFAVIWNKLRPPVILRLQRGIALVIRYVWYSCHCYLLSENLDSWCSKLAYKLHACSCHVHSSNNCLLHCGRSQRNIFWFASKHWKMHTCVTSRINICNWGFLMPVNMYCLVLNSL